MKYILMLLCKSTLKCFNDEGALSIHPAMLGSILSVSYKLKEYATVAAAN